MTYTVEITETLSRHVEIEATSEAEALAKANNLYRNEEIVLSPEDHVGEAEINIYKS